MFCHLITIFYTPHPIVQNGAVHKFWISMLRGHGVKIFMGNMLNSLRLSTKKVLTQCGCIPFLNWNAVNGCTGLQCKPRRNSTVYLRIFVFV